MYLTAIEIFCKYDCPYVSSFLLLSFAFFHYFSLFSPLFSYELISASIPCSFSSKAEVVCVGSTACTSKSYNVASSYTRLNLSPFWGTDNPLSQVNVGASIIHVSRLNTPAAAPDLPSIA
jgi:hypothetical protein